MFLRFFLITLLYFGLLLDMHFANGGWKQNWQPGNIGIMLMSYVFLLSLFFLVDFFFPKKYARWLSAFLALIYTLLNYYQRNTGYSLDFAVIANNWHAVDNVDGFFQTAKLLYGVFIAANVFWSVFAAVMFFFSYRWDVKVKTKKRLKWPAGAVFGLLGIALVTQISYSHDQFSRFGRSLYRWYVPMHTALNDAALNLSLLPPVKVESRFAASKKPHLFLVMIESFNGRFINQRHTDGREYTPYFNALTKENIYLPHYFSPSVQTGKGHFSALCGQVPSLKTIEYRSSNCTSLVCVPSYFQQYGYQTFFAQAHGDMGFDNERNFLLQHGIEDYPQLAKACSEETDPCYGWGLRDDYFYKRALAYLKKHKSTDKPLFAALATIASHQPFTGLPKSLRAFYPDPKNRREAYLNNLKMVDDSLKVLVEELKKSPFGDNAILIITGDHGFPLGEHGSFHNENFAFNENFGVPFLIMDLRKKMEGTSQSRPDLNLSGAYSHVNLPATLLDLAGFSGQTDFAGKSIFSKELSERGDTVYLVQPYSGGYIADIQWPYKYIFERARLGEVVYDLEKDPQERQDILPTLSPDVLSRLRQGAAQILRQQEVLSCGE